ncbi:MAG: hypothetical protein A3G52_04615 [Candidatus Taylorbacteria bacterium RIFCSPLOWO2_12_FULL_43_20]|uniref:Uncharacterized protein n=1 Tax=Candidatus Taylorbacteria bacterium RIFCSPLOWO2_12_FULL_43_20 TaxID=1802332 RepID=A0A1G2P290_9BACT|nr:MAG: hypothetical protein A2825_02535 [Candidatus Taylorbacteria bacterium RIFCSPHIGHO2_01_FULL_43_120]OHA22233.1 MAG: hypothetical protein A3B98_02735 [Candidatus Taylorbacteria bacterium RIFCSPHIGHO2_02_FULL_43_55]OHA28253.1 MAG: hypothetical protein A3E92_02835 [Candidatus Taylorbacteria bacterium RIFCSPHIGHO2_12_FULL_42_34]OHA30404.1 MAG: hypothetical protein A3B09_03380 [Candidatus Taylorbacteria bacterium RIFCSPLOWO2_01_FULL_43_83]OHA39657.1 MAG: hypothetical protein A3H58_02175 [Candi
MIRFVHKRHIHREQNSKKIIIFYSASDIFLGVALLALVTFFINDYLSHSLPGLDRNDYSFEKEFNAPEGLYLD